MKNRITALLAGIVLLLFSSLFAQIPNNLERIKFSEKPPLNSATVLMEIVIGTLSGGLIGFAGATIGVEIAEASEPDALFPSMDGAILGFVLAYPLGSAVGVFGVGDNEKETGSFAATLAGSYITALAFVLPAPIGATFGFNATRKYRPTPIPETGVINYQEGKLTLGVPTIRTNTHSFDRKALKHNINLVKVKF